MLSIFLIVSENPDEIEAPLSLCVIIMILIIILCFTLFVVWSRLFFYKKKTEDLRKDYLEMIGYGVAYERERIAKNMHDDVSTLLNVIKLNLTKVSRNYTDRLLSEKLIKDSLELTDESIDTIRNIAKELSPPSLEKLGYEKGVAELCRKISDSSRIEVGIILSENEVRLSQSKELQLYRMTQEVLNNIIKHSGVKEINISIKSTEKGVSTIISYYGFGITTELADELSETEKGCGLKSIQRRADLIDASINYIMIGSNEYRTTIDVPIFKNYDKNSCS